LVIGRSTARVFCWWLGALGFSPAYTQQPAGVAPAVTVTIAYLSREQADPARGSLLEPVVADYGLQGVQFGIEEINRSGAFLGKHYALIKSVVPATGDVRAAAEKLLASGDSLIIADLESADLLAVADLPRARTAVILDARTSDDSLRQSECRDNVFHLLPNWAMRADALGQYLVHKNWKRWLLVTGATPADRAYAAAVKRAAASAGATIVATRSYEYGAGPDSASDPREQLQMQLAALTHIPVAYDVVLVTDTGNAFGDYLLFNTWDPRLVAGTHGLTAVAWNSQFREYAARSVNYRFYLGAKRDMSERDYGNWLATAVIAEAVTRGAKIDTGSIKTYLLSDPFSVPANKGEGLTFRRWDHQLRQPLLLFGPRMLVSMAPQPDTRRAQFPTDALGFDQAQSKCRNVH
jgi:ABC transporter substrate binding protein (PQQ-dependent alcohol dehydrogenase system)